MPSRKELAKIVKFRTFSRFQICENFETSQNVSFQKLLSHFWFFPRTVAHSHVEFYAVEARNSA